MATSRSKGRASCHHPSRPWIGIRIAGVDRADPHVETPRLTQGVDMRGSVFLLFMVAGCGGAPDEPAVVGEDVSPLEVEPGVRVHRQRESQAPLRFSWRNLLDHHGGVLPASTTYAIWWGDQSAFPADAKDGIATLLHGLD